MKRNHVKNVPGKFPGKGKRVMTNPIGIHCSVCRPDDPCEACARQIEAEEDWQPETYSESARGITITRERAIQELATHGAVSSRDPRVDELGDFFSDLGDHETYLASDVLIWLGY